MSVVRSKTICEMRLMQLHEWKRQIDFFTSKKLINRKVKHYEQKARANICR